MAVEGHAQATVVLPSPSGPEAASLPPSHCPSELGSESDSACGDGSTSVPVAGGGLGVSFPSPNPESPPPAPQIALPAGTAWLQGETAPA